MVCLCVKVERYQATQYCLVPAIVSFQKTELFIVVTPCIEGFPEFGNPQATGLILPAKAARPRPEFSEAPGLYIHWSVVFTGASVPSSCSVFLYCLASQQGWVGFIQTSRCVAAHTLQGGKSLLYFPMKGGGKKTTTTPHRCFCGIL